MKTTKKQFCKIYPYMVKLRFKDPVQFSVLYNEWKRKFNQ